MQYIFETYTIEYVSVSSGARRTARVIDTEILFRILRQYIEEHVILIIHNRIITHGLESIIFSYFLFCKALARCYRTL